MEKQQPDYSSPAFFFGTLISLSVISYYIETYLGIERVITFVIWAILTLKVFIWIEKKGFSAGHPARFFAFAITFTVVGYYMGQTLNVETFIWFTLWVIVTLWIRTWVKNNLQADKRLFYLLSMQSIALAIIVPLCLSYVNPMHENEVPSTVTQAETVSPKHTVSSHEGSEQVIHSTVNTQNQFKQLLLSTIQSLIFILSVITAISTWRIGRRQALTV